MARDLAQRAAQRNTPANSEGQQTLAQQIQQMQAQFQMAMPRGAEAGQLVRDAMTCLRGTPKLADCYAPTVLGGLMTFAQLGLRPGVGGLGHGWLLPMYNGKERRMDATLIIGYRGYTELAYRHPAVKSIASRVVYTNDYFDLAFSLSGDTLTHRPALDGPRGDVRLFYAYAQLEGGHALTEPWSVAEMEAHRDRFAMAKTKEGVILGPWRDHFIEQGRKTMIRNPLIKMVPLSTELAIAAAVDEGVRIDLTPDLQITDLTEVTTHIPGELEPGDQPEPASGDFPCEKCGPTAHHTEAECPKALGDAEQ